jgi:hypothetical protein
MNYSGELSRNSFRVPPVSRLAVREFPYSGKAIENNRLRNEMAKGGARPPGGGSKARRLGLLSQECVVRLRADGDFTRRY